MSRGVPLPDLNRGEVYGCWVVVRSSSPLHRRRRYLVRSLCCSRETVTTINNILRRNKSCVHCKGNGRVKRVKTPAEIQAAKQAKAAWLKRRRAKALAEGKCGSCRKEPVKPGCRACIECLNAREDRREAAGA
jgi:hypothetical protein